MNEMLVFGAVQFKSSNDGGIEIIHDGTHQYLTKDELQELSSWLNWHTQMAYAINRNYGQPVGDIRPGGMNRVYRNQVDNGLIGADVAQQVQGGF